MPRVRTGPTLKEEKFLEHLFRGMNAVDAAIAAGYSDKSAAQEASRLKRKLEPQILERMQKGFLSLAPGALHRVSELSNTATQEAVKLKANQDILARAGFEPAQKLEVKKEEKTPRMILEHYIASDPKKVPIIWDFLPPEEREAVLSGALKVSDEILTTLRKMEGLEQTEIIPLQVVKA